MNLVTVPLDQIGELGRVASGGNELVPEREQELSRETPGPLVKVGPRLATYSAAHAYPPPRRDSSSAAGNADLARQCRLAIASPR